MEMDRKLAWKVMAIIVMAFTIGLLIGCGGMMLVDRFRDHQQINMQGNSLMLNLALQEKIKVDDMNLVQQAAYVVCALEAKDPAGASQAASAAMIDGLQRLAALKDDSDVDKFMKTIDALAKKSPAIQQCLAKLRQPQAKITTGTEHP